MVVIKRLGIFTLVRNMAFFVAIHVGKPHGMMESWNVGPPWRNSVLIASSGIIAWIIIKNGYTMNSVWAREYWV
jgi:hypothetical protein